MPDLSFRHAEADDLPAIVDLLADDEIGATREDNSRPLAADYTEAMAAITAQEGNDILVGEIDGKVVACIQLTIIPGLARKGMKRAQIDGVRVSSRHRGKQIGTRVFKYAIEQARDAGCGLVQLTTDIRRPDAKRFYEALGFEETHAGMKLSF
ncbi:GNAT family N-acetyltransferase [Aestuariispira ectoiniformans]|uniref:GNAT family N-acetyltransferase n=1 Tax=Aestuariispira ectoiniformans TaxID=2775080 RepID=UPI00223BB6BA|nr:GNAT family N-acetyltransferase [Aestuariispira ectoiniformans]